MQATIWPGSFLSLGLHVNELMAHQPCPRIRALTSKKWASKTPQNFGVHFNISETAEASDFKFGMQLGFANSHHKVTHRGKVGVAMG